MEMKRFTDCRCDSNRDKFGLCAAGIAECYNDCPFYFKVKKPTNADRIRGMSDEECSACGAVNFTGINQRTPFCPQCGARMDGEP